MTLWWIGDILLVLVVLPIVVYLLHGVLRAANGIVPTVDRIAGGELEGCFGVDVSDAFDTIALDADLVAVTPGL